MFITFEGIDGCGKSTIVKMVYERLNEEGKETIYSREPGGTDISEKIRDIILHSEHLDNTTEVLLYAASRSNHVNMVVKPALDKGINIILDRFVDASIVYQGYARNYGIQNVYEINKYAIDGCIPDLTFIIDLPVDEAAKRMENREKDRIEKEGIEFQRKVQEGFFQLVKIFPERNYIFIRGDRTIEEVFEDVWAHIKKHFQI